MIAVVCFISVLYMTSDQKSRLFGSIASRISTGSDSFTITVWAVFDSDPVGRHKLYHFVFAGFVPTVTFDSMLHNVSLTYIYNALPLQRVYTIEKIGSEEPIFGSFCYEVFPTLGYNQAANANCESFAFTFF